MTRRPRRTCSSHRPVTGLGGLPYPMGTPGQLLASPAISPQGSGHDWLESPPAHDKRELAIQGSETFLEVHEFFEIHETFPGIHRVFSRFFKSQKDQLISQSNNKFICEFLVLDKRTRTHTEDTPRHHTQTHKTDTRQTHTREDKTRHKRRQDTHKTDTQKTRQDKTHTQDKTRKNRQDKTQHKTRQDKTRQNTRQDKTRQDKTQDKTRHRLESKRQRVTGDVRNSRLTKGSHVTSEVQEKRHSEGLGRQERDHERRLCTRSLLCLSSNLLRCACSLRTTLLGPGISEPSPQK